MRITDLPSAWRDRLRPASFRGAGFHVETGAKQSGRRIVLHEYPKRDLPYAEDMGRRAKRFSIAAYLITPPGGPSDAIGDEALRWPDYTIPRDRLITELEQEGNGTLVHPTLGELEVVVDGYSVTETRERGGFCVFEISFVEAGIPGNTDDILSTLSKLNKSVTDSDDATIRGLDKELST